MTTIIIARNATAPIFAKWRCNHREASFPMKLSTTAHTPDKQLGVTLTSPPGSTLSLTRLAWNCNPGIVVCATLPNRMTGFRCVARFPLRHKELYGTVAVRVQPKLCDAGHNFPANNYARICITIRIPIPRKGARSRRVADFLSACKSVSHAGKALIAHRMDSKGPTPHIKART